MMTLPERCRIVAHWVRAGTIRSLLAVRTVFLPAMVVFSSGCTVTLNPNLASLKPVKAVPLSMGVYFSPELKSYEFRHEGYKISGDSGDDDTYAIGKATVEGFQQFFPLLFSKTEEVSSRPPPMPGSKALDGVIEPNLEVVELSSATEQPRRDRRYRVRLVYRFTLYEPNGKLSVFWINGYGSRLGRRFATEGSRYKEAMEEAMTNAAKTLAREFENIPEIQGWLETRLSKKPK